LFGSRMSEDEEEGCLEFFYSDGCGPTGAMAECGDTIFGVSFFQNIEQGYDDAGPGATKRVSQGDRAAVDIEPVKVDSEQFAEKHGIDRKGFVVLV
jgi:hypothetical protein